MSITIQHTQESLCLAHIHAVAGMAGVDLALRHVHDYGVDGQFDPVVIREARRVVSGFGLPFQAKSTTNWTLKDGHIVYDLEAKTYNDIVSRSESESTLVLVLLCLPKDQAAWHATSADLTTLRNCCYFHVLSGAQTDLPPAEWPETMIVWTTKGTTNAEQKAQAGRDHREAT